VAFRRTLLLSEKWPWQMWLQCCLPGSSLTNGCTAAKHVATAAAINGRRGSRSGDSICIEKNCIAAQQAVTAVVVTEKAKMWHGMSAGKTMVQAANGECNYSKQQEKR